MISFNHLKINGDYKVTESLPYFGCIALVDGLDAIDNLA